MQPRGLLPSGALLRTRQTYTKESRTILHHKRSRIQFYHYKGVEENFSLQRSRGQFFITKDSKTIFHYKGVEDSSHYKRTRTATRRVIIPIIPGNYEFYMCAH